MSSTPERTGHGSDRAVPIGGYPVVDCAALAPVVRRAFRRARRQPRELPRQRPGTVLVFQLGDGYEVLPEALGRLDCDAVVDAVAVAVVSTTVTTRPATAHLESANPNVCVTIRGSFLCRVSDAQLALESGCWDVDPFLVDHLLSDPRLRYLTFAVDPEQAQPWGVYQRNASARITAYHEMNPLVVPGLALRLTEVVIGRQYLNSPAPRPLRGQRDTGGAGGAGRSSGAAGRGGTRGSYGGRGREGRPGRDGNPDLVPDYYSWGEDDG